MMEELRFRRAVFFKVNLECRDKEVCKLRWDWECQVPELGTTVFIIPGAFIKNREDMIFPRESGHTAKLRIALAASAAGLR